MLLLLLILLVYLITFSLFYFLFVYLLITSFLGVDEEAKNHGIIVIGVGQVP